MPYKKGVFSVLKKVFKRKGKKIKHWCLQDYVMNTKKNNFCMKKVFFLENVCLSTRFDLRLKKNRRRFWAISKLLGKIFVSSSKKC